MPRDRKWALSGGSATLAVAAWLNAAKLLLTGFDGQSNTTEKASPGKSHAGQFRSMSRMGVHPRVPLSIAGDIAPRELKDGTVKHSSVQLDDRVSRVLVRVHARRKGGRR